MHFLSEKIIISTVVVIASLVGGTRALTCISPEDYSKCGSQAEWTSDYPCDLIVHRTGDIPTGLFCNNKMCFQIVTAEGLHEDTKTCFSTVTVANFSHCSGCIGEEVYQPFKDFNMDDDAENNILDLSHNDIQSSHVDNGDLLYGPFSNLDILYLSHNSLSSFPKVIEPSLRELWLDQNDIKEMDFTDFPEQLPQENLEFLNLRDNPMHSIPWRNFTFLYSALPNLQVLDIGSDKPLEEFRAEVSKSIWHIYPILARMTSLKKVYWPTEKIKCKCTMIAAFGRDLWSGFSIVTAKMKKWPHEEGKSAKDIKGDRYERYIGYYEEEKPVVCCDQSEHDLIGEKLENMNKVAKKFCPDISMDRVVMEEIM